VRAGSFRSRDGWLQYGGTLGGYDVAAYLRVGRTDGQRETVAADQQTLLDGVFNTRASLAPGPMNVGFKAVDASGDVSRGKLRLRGSYKLRDDLQTGAGVAGALDPVGRYRIQRVTSDLSWTDIELAEDWRATLTASYLHYQQTFNVPLQLFPPGAFGGSFPNGMLGAPSTWERQLRLAAVAAYGGIKGHALRMAQATTTWTCTARGSSRTSPSFPAARPWACRCRFPAVSCRSSSRRNPSSSRTDAPSAISTCRTNGAWPRTGR
jgi:iron complex outermembrane receptor protein